jgi:hypothetical protein
MSVGKIYCLFFSSMLPTNFLRSKAVADNADGLILVGEILFLTI